MLYFTVQIKDETPESFVETFDPVTFELLTKTDDISQAWGDPSEDARDAIVTSMNEAEENEGTEFVGGRPDDRH